MIRLFGLERLRSRAVDPALSEPFHVARHAARILFDFAAMILKSVKNAPVLASGQVRAGSRNSSPAWGTASSRTTSMTAWMNAYRLDFRPTSVFPHGQFPRSAAAACHCHNICLVLQLDRTLSDVYWLNVNDPGFPFVGVIEHTNLDDSKNYGGSHIAFVSRYLAKEDPVWQYEDQEYLDFALGHLKRMFPELERSWVRDFRVWRADYAQPVTERNYSQYVPDRDTPFANACISTMAHIYPEDRGANYAIREGRDVARRISDRLFGKRTLAA